MKPLLLTISFEGGAGGAAYRLHRGLKDIGVDSRVLIQSRPNDDEKVIPVSRSTLGISFNQLRPKLDELPLRLYPNRGFLATQWFPDGLKSKIGEINPDVVNLHWVGNGFVRIETLPKLNRPVVWTMHDMWPFTGGCYHSFGCERYRGSCGACPQLNSQSERDVTRWIWKRKASAWKHVNLTLVSPSNWLAECARSSSLFKDRRVEVIPNGLDLTTYKPYDRDMARKILKLPSHKTLVMFGAWINSHLKGFHLLQPALQKLSEGSWRDRIEVVTFGISRPVDEPDLGFKVHYLGRLNDDISLALAYSAVDVFVIPSIIENLSTTTMEALACGIPCVGFRVGGMPDLIDHQQNGYLAQPYEIEDLAAGIEWILENVQRDQFLKSNARAKAEKEFSLELQAQRYLRLFTELA